MAKSSTPLARGASRWWPAPMRFTGDAIALLRAAARVPRGRHGARWLLRTPVGIRALNARS
jgi:hypothetical protein